MKMPWGLISAMVTMGWMLVALWCHNKGEGWQYPIAMAIFSGVLWIVNILLQRDVAPKGRVVEMWCTAAVAERGIGSEAKVTLYSSPGHILPSNHPDYAPRRVTVTIPEEA